MSEPYEYTLANGEKRWFIFYRDANGKGHTKRGFKLKGDARKYLARVTTNIVDGDYIDPSLAKVTVNKLAASYLSGKHGTVKPKYYSNLESSYRTHVQQVWSQWQIGSIRYSDVQAWVSGMSADRSPTTVRRAYDVLNGICMLAVKDGLIKRNPCKGVRLPRKVAKQRTYLTLKQLLALADAAGDRRAVILVLGFCGLRYGELRALRVEDIDIERSRLLVRHSVVRVGSTNIEGLPKTHERREVPVPPYVMNVLLGEIVGKLPTALVFEGKSGGGYLGEVRRGARNWYSRAIETSGVPSLAIHDLRHTAASIAISSGANVKSVQRMLGHKTAAMTLDTYADLFDDDLDAVARDINRRITDSVIVL